MHQKFFCDCKLYVYFFIYVIIIDVFIFCWITGVDILVTASLLYSNKRTAHVTTTAIASLPNDLIITGTKGHIKVVFDLEIHI